MPSSEAYLNTTYTIRRPGCTAFTRKVRASDLAQELTYANDQVAGHIVVGESGELEGVEVSPAAVARAVARDER